MKFLTAVQKKQTSVILNPRFIGVKNPELTTIEWILHPAESGFRMTISFLLNCDN